MQAMVLTEDEARAFADMRAPYDALDPETTAEIEYLVAEHSLLFSRELLGFTDFTPEERAKFARSAKTVLRVRERLAA
jgi:alpha-ketoglutarate-dependent 2,4-dichlorophenoxyacetate dioxygenase